MNKVAAAPAAAEDDEEQEEQTTLTHIEGEQETTGEGEGGGEGSGAAHVGAKLCTAYIFKVIFEQSLNASQFKVAAREVLETKVHELKAHGAEFAVKYSEFTPSCPSRSSDGNKVRAQLATYEQS